MEMIEYPNYDFNPIFNEHSETIWDLKIDCNLCSNSNFNSKCVKCIINILKNTGIEKKGINQIICEAKWQLDPIGTKIILNLWKQKQGFENILSSKFTLQDEEEFLFKVFNFLREKFRNSELPENYFKSKKILLDVDTHSFLKYFLNRNLNAEVNLEEIFNPFLKKDSIEIKKPRKSGELKISYKTSATNLFQVEIYEQTGSSSSENYYLLIPLYEQEGFLHYVHIIQTISSNIKETFDPSRTLEEEIEFLKKKAIFELHKTFPGLKTEEKQALGIFTALNYLNISKLFGLLVDENVEEYFLDSSQDFFYLDHKTFGRCRTNVHLNEAEVESFKSLSKILSKKRLEANYPSLKYSLNLFNAQFRIAIDIGPVNLNEFSLAIRRPRKLGWKLCELIQNMSLSRELAAFLLWCARNGINITVTGETDTGKTTLINAIDKLLPLDIRRIYIEDVKESLGRNYDAHQIFFQASDTEENKSKSRLIISLLHRSPDFVYLGEILTQEEALAMFHALSVGLKGFQTIHAQSIKSLINRWIFHFKINPSSLQNLGLIIFMKKIGQRRLITEIAEIIVQDQKMDINYIAIFDPEQNKWIQKKNFFNSIKVQENLIYQNIDESEFYSALKQLEDIIMQQ